MKTTELYIEQVLIGALVLAILALPWAPEIWLLLADKKLGIGAVGGSAAALVSAAFWLGIPFDRLADTLFDRIEQRHRLRFAGKDAKTYAAGEDASKPSDPYPEDAYVIACLGGPSAVTDKEDYLRARLRLSRALAVYGPAIALMAVLSVAKWQEKTELLPSTLWAPIIVVAYLVWVCLVIWTEGLPRTDGEDASKYVPENEFDAWRAETATWAVPFVLIATSAALGAFYLCSGKTGLPLLAAIAGALLTVVSAWSWWRISKSYRKFILDCWRFQQKKRA